MRRLGVELSRRRTTPGLSQERVTNAAGVTRGFFLQLERGASRAGRVANPTPPNLVTLSQVLGTTSEDLLPDGVPGHA